MTSDQIQSAVGVEIDPEIAQIAKQLWQSAGLQIIEGDFTTLPPPITCKPNLIIANPPYVRHHHLDQPAKKVLQNKVRASLGLKMNGLAGLYCYFLLIANDWLEEGGMGVWLIPSEFMDVNYGITVKEYLANQVTLLHIHQFDPQDMQFEDALVSSTVLILKKQKPHPNHEVIFTSGGALRNPRQVKSIPQFQLSHIPKWTSLGNETLPYPVLNKDPLNKSITIGDIFTIQRGIATGANEFFILKRSLACEKEIPLTFLRPILPSPRYLADDKIFADDEGNPLVEPSLVLVDCDLQEEELDKFPTLAAYLAAGRSKGYADRYITCHRTPWFKQEKRLVAPILCTYMSRRKSERVTFRFFRNYSQATAANVYLLLYPKPEIQVVCEQEPKLLDELFVLLKQAREEYLLHEGRTYGGGLNKIEPKELARVSLPKSPILQQLDLKPKQLRLFER